VLKWRLGRRNADEKEEDDDQYFKITDIPI